LALKAFYDKFPTFSDNQNPLWLTGESYAGVYIPMLAQAALKTDDPSLTFIGDNLRRGGVMVGNGAIATGDW
jgi:carboxypeptidase C (cathepsin A)